jgi:hypothetical protein
VRVCFAYRSIILLFAPNGITNADGLRSTNIGYEVFAEKLGNAFAGPGR